MSKSNKKPNLLLLGIDSLRRDHMSAYGYHRLTTPHIDQYSKGGVLFEQHFSPSIPTTPGYASMLTGMDCFGITSWRAGRRSCEGTRRGA
ncbi:sulfatase-like hydrolase/transferase [Paenibacillus alginolyticus]|uniref:sulfatase-like hydrolase/transferase n=1 Tax=Paenibacillus alginolyticus TaxID=59839 RepID=UPI001C2641BA|nr:sulfatase-like hydrolase/transferase [Paenibacillus frigoriresistens]